MEIVVTAAVGVLGAAATILAAYIQRKGSQRPERAILNVPEGGSSAVTILDVRSENTSEHEATQKVELSGKPAFAVDLLTEPLTGELILATADGAERECVYRAIITQFRVHLRYVHYGESRVKPLQVPVRLLKGVRVRLLSRSIVLVELPADSRILFQYFGGQWCQISSFKLRGSWKYPAKKLKQLLELLARVELPSAHPNAEQTGAACRS